MYKFFINEIFKANSAEELVEIAQKNNLDIAKEKVEALYEKSRDMNEEQLEEFCKNLINTADEKSDNKSGALKDDELNNVAGGACGKKKQGGAIKVGDKFKAKFGSVVCDKCKKEMKFKAITVRANEALLAVECGHEKPEWLAFDEIWEFCIRV